MMPKLLPLKSSGCKTDWEIINMGFSYKVCFDSQNNETYFKLFVRDKFVGDTEYNDVFDEYEIVCYDEKSYKLVKKFVRNKVNVWAWFNAIGTNEN